MLFFSWSRKSRGASKYLRYLLSILGKAKEPQNVASLYFGSTQKKPRKNASIFACLFSSWSRKSDLN